MENGKYVYYFGGGEAEGSADMKNKLGGKGANLAEMASLGIPVPPGFTISTDVCTYFYENDSHYPDGLTKTVEEQLKRVEEEIGYRFGDSQKPLLLSIRSGARVSMPGMMDTVLNLGLNDRTVEGIASIAGDQRFAWDCYRRFVQMYGDVVLAMKPDDKDDIDPFEEILARKKAQAGAENDVDLNVSELKELTAEFKKLIKDRKGIEFPDDPMEQLWNAIGAVFNSWNNDRAISYRRINGIPHHWGTAVNVQSMVFGNLGAGSGTGVAFTRNPATGEKNFYGEYLLNAQGEDVVAGIRTPHPINIQQKVDKDIPSLEEEMNDIYNQLLEIRDTLEEHYKDMQDLEFTIQKQKLWILQTRTGKRTGFAAIRIAVDMVREGIIGRKEAISRLDPEQLNQYLQPVFDADEKNKAVEQGKLIARGINAGPGAASGKVVFNAEDAEDMARKGEKVILVRIETSPEDIRGMSAADGILTSAGGATSHAALVARQMGKVCVAGARDLNINYRERSIKVGDTVIKEGEYISIDGTTGEVISGQVETTPSDVIRVMEGSLEEKESDIYSYYRELMEWADNFRELGVRANADRESQAAQAASFGAEGIGLCRTEHMFFEGDRINAIREMILATDSSGREKALEKLLPMQKEDFKKIFRAMDGKPVTVRTLDPPLHEFLPSEEDEIARLAKNLGTGTSEIEEKIASLKEQNPMLGHRGCRLGIVFPEITAMQARAIFEAASELKGEGMDPRPEIMIPLVGSVKEFHLQEKVVREVAEEVQNDNGVELSFLVGTMIEIPRACLTADRIAERAQFFSFGTNDLTQTTFGISRDDAGKFMAEYLDKDIWPSDPFQKLDVEGVGQLVETAVTRGRNVNSGLKIGICGEHGGDPSSVRFCYGAGLDYVSCSPFRVPIAILAAAQATLEEERG
ncbi:MAG: pyruvate, phosphate dikinase [Candidatus Latescibacteria bacterium]|nr:pyruvate, phosphate dikinase [bacterium]MBD3423890.1 pyruvate, phosphate dikinase [Candidatus Latescibacterota bacterium]